jgi:hypothetical protein
VNDDQFVGRNPSNAVNIVYYLRKRHIFGDMSVEIYDSQGNKIKTLPAGKRKGINRVPWIPTRKPPRVPKSNVLVSGAIFGPEYLPGNYAVKVLKGEEVYETTVAILHDPDSPHSLADQDLQIETVNKAYDLLEDLAYLDRRITDMVSQTKAFAADPSVSSSLKKKLTACGDELSTIRKKLLVTKVGDIRGEQQLREKVSELYSAVGDYRGRPTQSQIDRLTDLQREAVGMVASVDAVFAKYLVSLNQQLEKARMQPIKITTREEFDAEGEE